MKCLTWVLPAALTGIPANDETWTLDRGYIKAFVDAHRAWRHRLAAPKAS